jgi:hypothetical protein
MARTTLAELITEIEEELKFDWAGGEGFSKTFLTTQINKAISNLAGLFTIRDTVEFTATEDTNSYSLVEKVTTMTIENILKLQYDGETLKYMQVKEYLELDDPDEGDVEYWTLFGDDLILIGDVEEKTVKLWVTRAPAILSDDDDTPETPYYADEAIRQYAISACYRQSNDYDRSNYHFSLFREERRDLERRGIPQGQRAALPVMSDDYWPVYTGVTTTPTSDTNPGGD